MDQHFLWKSHPHEEAYAPSTHDSLPRDRFDGPRLRLDPTFIKHGLGADGNRVSLPGIDKHIANISPLGHYSTPLPPPPLMGQGGDGSNAHEIDAPSVGALTAASLAEGPGNDAPETTTAPDNIASRNFDPNPRKAGAGAPEGTRKVISTKRAAQNRNSQNAFRKRRQKYIEELESTAKKVKDMQKTIDDLRLENMMLRELTAAIQARLLAIERENETLQQGDAAL